MCWKLGCQYLQPVSTLTAPAPVPVCIAVAYGVIAGIVAYIALHLPQWLRQYVVTPAFRKLRRKKSSIGEVENNGPPSNTSSQRQVRRRPVHRKVFGESFHRSQSEDAISNSSFRMNGAALEEMMIADGHHMHSSPMAIRIGSGASHAFASGSSHGVRRTTSHGSLAHLDASNHSKMSYASARGGLPVQPYSRQGSYGASVNESPGKTGALGMAAGGYGGFPMQRQGPLPRTVSLGGGGGGARVGPYGGGAPRLMSIGRSRTYGDLEAAALQARAAYDGDMSGSYGARRPHSDVDPNEARAGFQLFPEVSTQSIEPEHGGDSGNNFKLFGDFQPLDIDLGPDSDDEEAPAAPAGGAQNGAAAAVQPPAAADQNGASSGSIDMSLPRESVVLSAGTGSPDDFTRGSSVDLTMFRRSSKGGSPSDAPQGTSDGSTSNAADLSTSISLGSSSLGKAISTALRHGHLSHQDNGTAAVRVSIEVPSEPLRRIEGWPGDGQKESSLGDAVPAAPAVEEKPPAKPPAVNLLPSVVSAPASTARRPSKPALKRVESAAALRLRSLFSSDGEGPGPSTEPAPTEKHMAVRVNSAPHAVVSNGAGAPVASPFEDQGLGSWGQVLSPRAEAAAKALNLPQTIVSGVVWHDEGHPRSQQEKRK